MSIQIKRGMKKDLPQLKDGELAFCRDTKELYVGSNGNENVNVTDRSSQIIEIINTPKFSEELINENVTSFKVGTSNVNGVDLTNQMEQSLVALDNIKGKTLGRTVDSQLPSIRINEIGIPVSNDETVYDFKLSTNPEDYEQGSLPAWVEPWSLKQNPPDSKRIRVIEPIKIPEGTKYIYVRNRNINYYFSIIYCKDGGTGNIIDDIPYDDYGWMNEDKYTGVVLEVPRDVNSIGLSVRTASNTVLNPTDDAPHIRGSIRFLKDVSRISNEDLFLCSLPGGNIYDELKDGVICKRVNRIKTSIDAHNWKTVAFSTVKGANNITYGRLTISLPNSFITSLEHIDCGSVEVIDYSINQTEWDMPSKNSLFINTFLDKTRISFTLSGRTTQQDAEKVLLKDNPRIITYRLKEAKIINTNPSINANSGDLLFICSPIELTSTHKVQLNIKSQVEILQKAHQQEKNSTWQKLKNLTDVKMKIEQDGYIKLPTVLGGLILQWGVAPDVPSRSFGIVNFKIPFNQIFIATSTANGGDLTSDVGTMVICENHRIQVGNAHPSTRSINWFAIGK